MEHYRILGLEKEASQLEIKKAYRKMARLYHPDLNPGKNAQERFIRVKIAYDTLCDPLKRENYDSGFSYKKTSYHQQKNRAQKKTPPAKRKEQAFEAAEILRLLVFELDGHDYALDIDQVFGIVGSATIKYFDHNHGPVVGRLNSRGEDWFIVDLAKCFNLATSANDKTQKVILTTHADFKVGFLVSDVDLVTNLTEENLQAATHSPLKELAYLSKMAVVENRMIFILDLEHILPGHVLALLKELA